MKLKKFALILLFSLFCFTSFAEGSYKLSVVNAEEMAVSEDFVELEGGVEISFVTEEDSKERKLNADRVVIDVKNKNIEALGNVLLKESDSTFQGEALTLNWDNLDIVVFGGTSSSNRKGSTGNSVKFYTVGDRISYSSDNDVVFFKDGIIATRDSDPYWSIRAKKLGLSGSDIFFSNATLRLGRVPFMWLPVLFYPGNRLSFNPAIGFSSVKGQFLNTTYEVYGRYPKIGNNSYSSENMGDAGALASNFLSFLDSDKEVNALHAGWSYTTEYDEEKLSDLQKWALKTNSYFAAFADVWELYGFSMGYETKNNLFDNKLTVNSTGVFNYRNRDKSRYSLQLDATYKFDKGSLSLTMPLMSDPDVRYDLLNRNTVFGLDSVFGAKQTFNSAYSSDLTKNSIILDGSVKPDLGKFNLDISKFKAQIDYAWNSKDRKYEITSAVIPYISVKSSGKIFSKSGESKSKEVESKLSSKQAQSFYDELELLNETSDNESENGSIGLFNLKPVSGKSVSTKSTVKTPASYLNIDYSFNQVIENDYSNKFKDKSFYTKIDGSLDSKAKAFGNWIDFSDSIKPVYDLSIKEKSNTSDFKVQNATTLAIPEVGLTYGITSYVFYYEKNNAKVITRKGQWNKKDITSHYLDLNKKIEDFSLSLKYVLPPLDQVLTPSVKYAHGGLSSSLDFSFDIKKDSAFKPKIANAKTSYGKGNMSVSFDSSYNFEKKGPWEGFTLSEQFGLSFYDNKLKLNQSMNMEKKLKFKNMAFSAAYEKNTVKLTLKDSKLSPDKFDIFIVHDSDPRYFWKNRIGFDASVDFGFTYDFQNKYNSSLYADISMAFAINKFLDLSLSIKSANTSFYRYYEKNAKGVERFSVKTLFNDLVKSFDFFGNGRYNTGFNLSSFSLTAVHYMEDWKLTVTSSSSVKTNKGKSKFVPEVSFLIQWNAIPELKTTNSWTSTTGWEKK